MNLRVDGILLPLSSWEEEHGQRPDMSNNDFAEDCKIYMTLCRSNTGVCRSSATEAMS